jgi:hypothetical protein
VAIIFAIIFAISITTAIISIAPQPEPPIGGSSEQWVYLLAAVTGSASTSS